MRATRPPRREYTWTTRLSLRSAPSWVRTTFLDPVELGPACLRPHVFQVDWKVGESVQGIHDHLGVDQSPGNQCQDTSQPERHGAQVTAYLENQIPLSFVVRTKQEPA
jgi:hypothetical protein